MSGRKLRDRASLWALVAVFVVCVAYELAGGPNSGLWGPRPFLRETGNFTISVPPAVYFTVYCLIVPFQSPARGLRRYAVLAASTLLPSTLLLPMGSTTGGAEPLIYVLSVSAGIYVGYMTLFLLGIPGMVAGILVASAMLLVPVALAEWGCPSEGRVPLRQHWLGIFGFGWLAFGLFMISVNVNVGGSALLSPLCFLPHVLAAGGIGEAVRLAGKRAGSTDEA